MRPAACAKVGTKASSATQTRHRCSRRRSPLILPAPASLSELAMSLVCSNSWASRTRTGVMMLRVAHALPTRNGTRCALAHALTLSGSFQTRTSAASKLTSLRRHSVPSRQRPPRPPRPLARQQQRQPRAPPPRRQRQRQPRVPPYARTFHLHEGPAKNLGGTQTVMQAGHTKIVALKACLGATAPLVRCLARRSSSAAHRVRGSAHHTSWRGTLHA